MEASGDSYSALRRALTGELEWMIAAAEREYELNRLLDPTGDASAADEFEVLVEVLWRAVISTARAETGIRMLLGQVAAAQDEEDPSVRFDHPRLLRDGWSVLRQTQEGRELVETLDRLLAMLKDQA